MPDRQRTRSFLGRGGFILHDLALDPVSETTADRNSYGFHMARSAHDALEQCFTALGKPSKSAQWVLDADIKGCFAGGSTTTATRSRRSSSANSTTGSGSYFGSGHDAGFGDPLNWRGSNLAMFVYSEFA